MASSLVSIANSNSKLSTLLGDMTSAWWKQLPLNEINAKSCFDRLLEIQATGQTFSVDGGAGDVYLLL